MKKACRGTKNPRIALARRVVIKKSTREWPAEVPLPQANIEFDVESVDAVADAARELEAAGYPILVGPKMEPWNQTVVRVLGPEGMLVTISFTPWLHESAD